MNKIEIESSELGILSGLQVQFCHLLSLLDSVVRNPSTLPFDFGGAVCYFMESWNSWIQRDLKMIWSKTTK